MRRYHGVLSSIFRRELQWIKFGNRKFALSGLCARVTAIYRRESGELLYSPLSVSTDEDSDLARSLVYSTSCETKTRASRIARSEIYRNALQSARSREYGGRMPRAHLQSHRPVLVTTFELSVGKGARPRGNDVASPSTRKPLSSRRFRSIVTSGIFELRRPRIATLRERAKAILIVCLRQWNCYNCRKDAFFRLECWARQLYNGLRASYAGE